MSGLSFLHSGFLVALLGISIPIIIHLIHRRRAIRWRFAAMEFLLRSHQRVARRLQLKQLLLLILRCLLVALAVLAFSKPFFKRATGSSPTTPKATVLIIDDSLSMRFQSGVGRKTLFAQAKAQARILLAQMRGEDKVALLKGSSNPNEQNEQNELTFDKGSVKNKLDRWKPSYRGTDLHQAIRKAATILKQVKGLQPHIIILSDFARNSLESSKAPTGANFASIELLPIRPKKAVQNRSITKVLVEPAPFAALDAYRFTVTVKNFSKKAVQDLSIRLFLGGRDRAKGFVQLKAFGQSRKQFIVQLPRTGQYTGYIEIGKDDLLEDNRYFFSLQARKRPKVLVVNGDPRNIPYLDELFYLGRSLRDPSTPFVVQTKLATSLLPEPSNFDVIYLVNVSQFPSKWLLKLEKFVKDGGGLLISSGNQLNAQYYNEKLAKLLPRPLRHIALAAQRPDGTGVALKRNFGQLQVNHPAFQKLYQNGIQFQSARVTKLMLVEPSSSVQKSTILWRYSHGPPALLEREVGKGRVFFFTTSLDRDWTDLAIRPYFLPLIHSMTTYLAGGARFQQSPKLLIGQRLVLNAKGNEPIEVHAPTGKSSHMRPSTSGFIFRGGQFPGIYKFSRTNQLLKLLPKAINTDPIESDLSMINAKNLQSIGTLSAQNKSLLLKQSERLWPFLLLALILFFLLENAIMRYM